MLCKGFSIILSLLTQPLTAERGDLWLFVLSSTNAVTGGGAVVGARGGLCGPPTVAALLSSTVVVDGLDGTARSSGLHSWWRNSNDTPLSEINYARI